MIKLFNKLKTMIMKPTKTSNNGIALIKEFEGFEPKPYICPAGVPTIGYGSTYYPNGNKVKMTDKSVSVDEATEIMRNVLKEYEKAVLDNVTTKINQNQFDALVSFAYNVGIKAFKGSTLLKMVNVKPNELTIAHQFNRWNKSNGKVLSGLTRRRKAETELYYKL